MYLNITIVKSPAPLPNDVKPQNVIPPVTQSIPATPMIVPSAVSQMRIFIDNLQKFRVVEVPTDANAGEVVDLVMSQVETTADASYRKNCMLFEICQDFGLGE